MVHSFLSTLVVLGSILFVPNAVFAQKGKVQTLSVRGCIKAEDKKLEGCRIITFLGNDSIGMQTTTKSGKFEVPMERNKEYGIVFKCEGFVPKRIIVDTHAKISDESFAEIDLDMFVTMLAAEKFEGANTDALDFPFAILKYDRKANAILEDPTYTAGMMRTNGALMLVAGRSGKN